MRPPRLAPGALLSCWRPLGLLLLLLAVISPTAFADGHPRIAVISDTNGRYGSTGYHLRVGTAIKRIIALQPDLVISTGDMVAGQKPSPKLSRLELEAMWTSFHQQIRGPLEAAGIPVIMTPGNHDASAYRGFELERQIYSEYHRAHPPMFKPKADGDFPYYFSTQLAGVKLVSLDATRAEKLSRQQIAWLEQQLSPGPTIVFGHLPLQPVSVGRERDIISDLYLEKLLRDHGQAIYLSGHHHAYYPGRRAGIDMLSMGNLGGNLRRLLGANVTTGFSFAILDYSDQALSRIRAFVGPDFDQPIDHASLPTSIGNGAQQLRRLEDPPTAESPKTKR